MAKTIYDSFIASDASAMIGGHNEVQPNQQKQVQVDVSDLRKSHLVTKFRQLFDGSKADANQSLVEPHVFDKAAQDVRAFVEPCLHDYIEARKEGSFVVDHVEQEEFHSPPKSSNSATVSLSFVDGLDLHCVVAEGGEVFSALLSYAHDIGRQEQILFLRRVALMKTLENDRSKCTEYASNIMRDFIEVDGPHVLDIPAHIRSGPKTRYAIFAPRNLIKPDFFDSVAVWVMEKVESDTWERFVDQCQRQRVNPVVSPAAFSTSSELSESSEFENDNVLQEESIKEEEEEEEEEDHFDALEEEDSASSSMNDSFNFGATMHRGEIEKEVKRRLEEESTQDAVRQELGFSPATARALLETLESQQDPTMCDTVMLPSKSTSSVPSVLELFSNKPSVQPLQPKQENLAHLKPLEQRRTLGVVWPSRSERLLYGEGKDAKGRRWRYFVLKNKTMYVWKSESHYRKNKEPIVVLDCDSLLRTTLVREKTKIADRWTLRCAFEGLNQVVVLGCDSRIVLNHWKQDLLNSAPHLIRK